MYNIVSVVCLQRCSVRTVWFMRPVVLPVLRRVPALLLSLIPSAAPSPVWRDVSVLTALWDTVRGVCLCVCALCVHLMRFLVCSSICCVVLVFCIQDVWCLSVVCRWRLYPSVSVSVWVGRIFISCRSDCHSTLSELVSLESLSVILKLKHCSKQNCNLVL